MFFVFLLCEKRTSNWISIFFHPQPSRLISLLVIYPFVATSFQRRINSKSNLFIFSRSTDEKNAMNNSSATRWTNLKRKKAIKLNAELRGWRKPRRLWVFEKRRINKDEGWKLSFLNSSWVIALASFLFSLCMRENFCFRSHFVWLSKFSAQFWANKANRKLKQVKPCVEICNLRRFLLDVG